MKNAFYFPLPHNASFGERITALKESKGIKTIQSLAEEIFYKLDKYEKTDSEETNNSTIESIRKRIVSHLKPNCNPKMDFIKEYCMFFECEADFLLGYIDFPTKENQGIYETTGLNNTSIATLSSLFNYQKNMEEEYQPMEYNPIETLNILLSDEILAEQLLKGIQDLLNSDYKIPAYHTVGSTIENVNEKYDKCLVPEYVVPKGDGNIIKGFGKFNDMYLLTLVKDKEKTWENKQIALDDDFFEAVALRTIEKYLRKIRDNYSERK